MIFAGVSPPDRFVATPAPGETVSQARRGDDEAVTEMVNVARATEQLPPLVRDPVLDKLAKLHSMEMLKTRLVAHDVGTGDPAVRLRDAGVNARVAGENVAAASSLANAHRALWASPAPPWKPSFDRVQAHRHRRREGSRRRGMGNRNLLRLSRVTQQVVRTATAPLPRIGDGSTAVSNSLAGYGDTFPAATTDLFCTAKNIRRWVSSLPGRPEGAAREGRRPRLELG